MIVERILMSLGILLALTALASAGQDLSDGGQTHPAPEAKSSAEIERRWQRLDAAQARVKRALTTRIAEFQRTLPRDGSIALAQTKQTAGDGFPAATRTLDDFGISIEGRRQRIAPQLDDLTPVRRSSGS